MGVRIKTLGGSNEKALKAFAIRNGFSPNGRARLPQTPGY